MTILLAILVACTFAILVVFFIGKNLPERLIFLGLLMNNIIILLCLFSLLKERESFVDIAYIYVLLGMLVNLSIKNLYYGKDSD